MSTIDNYINHLRKVRNLSAGTCHEYEKNLRAFAIWVNVTRPGRTWETVEKSDVEAHMQYMNEAGMKPRTIQLRVSAISGLYSWFRQCGHQVTNPARYVQRPKAGQQLPQTVDTAAVVEYLSRPALTMATLEIQALTALLVETGIRIQEAIDIRPSDIDSQEQSIIINGKGNKQRKVYYGNMTREKMNALACHRDYRNGFFQPDQQKLREEMTAEFRGLIDYIHPHMLRHTFATTMLANGAQLKYVSSVLGHESVKTTERYTHVSNPALKKTVNATAPRLQA